MPALTYLFTDILTAQNILIFVYIMNFIISLGLIFVNHKRPTVTMAWIMVLYMLPVIGLIMYIIFAQNIAKLKIGKMTEEEENMIEHYMMHQKEEYQKGKLFAGNDLIVKWKNVILQNYQLDNGVLSKNKDVELIVDGNEMFDRLCEDIRNAKYSIKVCYFIIKDDEVGMALINLLTEKAKEGLKVRLLMDALGSKSIGNKELKEFKAAGGHVGFFFKPRIRHLFIRVNFRNHRKLVVIDNEIGYIGGFNIAREYLGLKKKFGYWRDTQFIIRGNAVAAMNKQFFLDWKYSTGEQIDNIVEDSIKYSLKEDNGELPIMIVSSGPNSKTENIKHSMMRMIMDAQESVYIQTPYLVLDEAMMESICMAAAAGVDVRIMIPCMPDHPFVYRTTKYNAGILMQCGAKIYIYDNGFLHAKTLVVDGEVSTAGSCNFDIRSFRLNFESNAIVFDEEFAQKMNKQFERDMKLSHEYTLEDRAKLTLWDKIAESVSRLLTEIL